MTNLQLNLKERLEDIKLPFDFQETLAIITKPSGASEPSGTTSKTTIDVEDDLKRELSFYKQALAAARFAREEFIRLGGLETSQIETTTPRSLARRPDDFYAEMIKSDKHMVRIKQNLVFQSKKIEKFEKRKRDQEQKKFAKQRMAEQQKEQVAKRKESASQAAMEFRGKSASNGDKLAKRKGLSGSKSGQFGNSKGRHGKGKPSGKGSGNKRQFSKGSSNNSKKRLGKRRRHKH